MKNLKLFFLLMLASCASKETESLKVMTYNIRLDVASDGENAWAKRKDFLISQINFYEPTIFGVQEARPNQMLDINSNLTNYSFIGQGRDGENIGEFSAIFYDSTKVSFTNERTFWLSETPKKISKGWDAAYPRICTYGLMSVLNSDEKIWVFNTHLDHKGNEAQLNGIQLIEAEIKKVNKKNYPVILMGDFNITPESELISNLKINFNDAKELAGANAFGQQGTFNGFKFQDSIKNRIDYIFISKKANINLKKYGVLTDSKDLKYPSDHFPVFVEFQKK
tara:strand:- start:6068 stop:6907 length:840 start_codon:yes stop_codon:yes gene_type:complete